MKHRWITWIVLLALMVGLLPSGNLESVGAQDSSATCKACGVLRENAAEDDNVIFTVHSPDGTHLAYVIQSFESANASLWISQIDGSEATLVIDTDSGVSLSEPVWSPDSQYMILYKFVP